MNKTNIKTNKPTYLVQSILDISKTLMYEFWYGYFKPKYHDRIKLCYIDTDSFVIEVKTEDFYVDISDDVEKWNDTSNYDKEDKRPFPIGINKKIPGLIKDQLGGKIIIEFCAIRVKTYASAVYDGKKIKEKKRAKGTKKCVIKNELMLQHYKNSLFNVEVIRKSQLRFKSDCHDVYIEKINKIALRSNDDKRIQTFDKITTHPYGKSVFKICENKMKNICNAKETLKNDSLYVTSSIFLNYLKRKCAAEIKRYVKLPKKRYKI